ncbi:hypothetical protein A3F65_01585 [Candidatus Saccharibacteria bacterium RIFCSPHIGHO2_12_FULL_47_16b]|nr:MAG: hypothetical protein A3F65_01585 [Candidatus Saccharibacteria bacterium RIFCSPHIGHO2_12_FULL_47_16b]
MIVLFGIAGSGKGTQAEILAKRLNCPIVTTGDILRKNQANPAVKAATEAGKLVPDEITLSLLEQELSSIGADGNEFILDGSPRTLTQAKWLAERIKNGQIRLTAIIHIKLSKDEALKRLKLRARHDDTEASIQGRFNFYQNSVIPALNYMKAQGYKVIEIDGEQSVESVAAKIDKALGL